MNKSTLLIILVLILGALACNPANIRYETLNPPSATPPPASPTATTATESVPTATATVAEPTATMTQEPEPTATATVPPTATPSATSLPTETPPPTPELDIPSGVWFGERSTIHNNQSSIIYLYYWYGADGTTSLEMVDGAELTFSLTKPDQSVETKTSMTDADGTGEVEFDIFVYGNYELTITNVVLPSPNLIYDPAHNAILTNTGFIVGPEEETVGIATNVVAFVDMFNEAVANGDQDFLYGHLHPAIIELYGAETCRDYLASVGPPPAPLEIENITDFGDWVWEIDGMSIPIMHAYTVQTNLGEVHFARTPGNTVSWFTDCGDPQ